MNKEYILLSIILIGTLTIVGMFIHINARFGMRKAFLELINRKSFLAITVIIINTVISYAMIHFNELNKLSQHNQSQNIQKDKEEEQKNNQQNEGDEQNGGSNGVTESSWGDTSDQPVIPGLETEMKNAFNTWASNNSNRSPQWVSFSGTIGKVKIDGAEKNVQRLSSGKIVIMGTNPLIILN